MEIVVDEVVAVDEVDVVVTGIHVFSIFECCLPEETGNCAIIAFSSVLLFGIMGMAFWR